MEGSQRCQEIHLGLTLLLIYFTEKTHRKFHYDGRKEYWGVFLRDKQK